MARTDYAPIETPRHECDDTRRWSRVVVGVCSGVGLGVLAVALLTLWTSTVAPWGRLAEQRMRADHAGPARSNVTVLLAAFEAFGEHAINPAQNVSRALHGTCVGPICFRVMSIPVTRAGVQIVPQMLVRHSEDRPDAIIHLGLDASSFDLKLEIVAANVAAMDGAQGGLETSEVVSLSRSHSGSEGPEPFREIAPGYGLGYLLPTTANFEHLFMKGLTGNHVAQQAHHSTSFARFSQTPDLHMEFSRDLGAFFCNEAYFRTLHAVHLDKIRVQGDATCGKSQRLMPVLFIHLPLLLHDADVLSASLMVAYIAQSITQGD